MLATETVSLEDFWVIGINHENTDTAIRGRFAISDDDYAQIIEEAPAYGISQLFVLSTCNRTEIYGCTQEPELMTHLLCQYTEGTKEEFELYAYKKHGKKALAHVFHVAAGLDSQILGDYEIIGQLKKAVEFSRAHGGLQIFLDRLFKNVLQACRAIRSKTRLSSGTVSVAYAAIKFLKKELPVIRDQKVLVIGLGKIGKNAVKNLMDILPGSQIALCNRTSDTAVSIAKELGDGVKVIDFEDRKKAVQASDIIIVATGAPEPVLMAEDVANCGKKILLDLSIPNNIDPQAKEIPGITLANVDDLSKINDQTLERRKAEIPRAQTYITTYIHKFAEWYIMHQNVPVLKGLKAKLSELNQNLGDAEAAGDEDLMQTVINKMAAKMRKEGGKNGCYYLQAINGYLAQVDSGSSHK